MAEIVKYRWDNVKKEKLSETFYRQMVYGDKVMVAQLDIRKGSIVPEHSHENEQITWIMKGKLHFKIGGKEMDVINIIRPEFDFIISVAHISTILIVDLKIISML